MKVAAILKPGVSPQRLTPFREAVEAEWFWELRLGLDAILLFGGDGTIRRHLPQLCDLDTPVLPVPTGSGNDFASSLGICNPRHALALWRRFVTHGDNVRLTDLGTVFDSSATKHLFCNVANLGLDSDINRRANALSPFLRANGGYVLSLFPALLRYRAPMVRLTVDGSELLQSMTLAVAANGSRYGRGLKIAPGANMSDGMLDLCFVRETSRLKIAALFPLVYFGQHLRLSEVQYIKFRTLEIETPQPMDIFADGDFLCHTPATISVLPKALRVITL